jgi:hypothetical protein
MIPNTRHKKLRMARRKQFSDRTTLAFPPGTFAAIEDVTGENEDRSDLIRAAVEKEVALRRSASYADLKAHLLVNESIEDFCLKAIARAVAQRKAAVAGDELSPDNPAE